MKFLLEYYTKIRKKSDVEVKDSLQYIIEKKNYYKKGDIVLIEYWYNDIMTCVVITDIIGRSYKVSHNISESKIKNAPDEIVKVKDIIDKYRIKGQ